MHEVLEGKSLVFYSDGRNLSEALDDVFALSEFSNDDSLGVWVVGKVTSTDFMNMLPKFPKPPFPEDWVIAIYQRANVNIYAVPYSR